MLTHNTETQKQTHKDRKKERLLNKHSLIQKRSRPLCAPFIAAWKKKYVKHKEERQHRSTETQKQKHRDRKIERLLNKHSLKERNRPLCEPLQPDRST